MLELTADEERQFNDHLRAVNAREICPICDGGKHTLLISGAGWGSILRTCARCRLVTFYNYRPILDARGFFIPGKQHLASR